METRAHQVSSGRLKPWRECPSHCYPNCYAGFPGLAGLPPAPRQKKTPSFGGGRCLRHGKKQTRETRVFRKYKYKGQTRIYLYSLADESRGYNTHFTLRNIGREVERHMLR